MFSKRTKYQSQLGLDSWNHLAISDISLSAGMKKGLVRKILCPVMSALLILQGVSALAANAPRSRRPVTKNAGQKNGPKTKAGAALSTVTLYSIGSEDGRMLSTGITAADTGVGALRVGDWSTNLQYRSILSFDTSSIPATATVQSATLKLTCGGVGGSPTAAAFGAIKADVKTGFFGASAALAQDDYSAAVTAEGVATLSYTATPNTVSSGSLSAAGLAAIQKGSGGKTQFRLYFSNTTNSNNNYDYIGYYGGEYTANPAYRPALEITYSDAPAPDFSLSASPATQTVNPGQTASFTISTAVLNGFASVVQLAVAGLPTGATGTFSPSSITGGGSATLSIPVPAGAAAKTYPLTITGTSGTLSRSASVNLVVNGASLPAITGFSPASGVVGTPVTLTGTNLTGATSVSFNGTAASSFNVASPSSITAVVAAGTTTGKISVTTPSGTATSSADFSILTGNTTVSLYSIASEDGRTVSNQFNATDAGTSALRLGDYQANAQYRNILSFDTSGIPAAAAIQSATLKLTRGMATTSFPDAATFGAIKADIKTGFFGSSAALAAEDWSAAATATGVATLNYPASNNTVSSGALNASGLAAIQKGSGGKTQFRTYFANTTNTTASKYLGFYSGEYTATPTYRPTLEVTYSTAPDFALAATPPSQTIVVGQSGNFTVNASALNGFTGTIQLSLTGLPAGATGVFSPASIAGSGSSVLSLAVPLNAAPGNYPLTITGTSGSLPVRSVSVSLVVSGLPAPVITAPASVVAGQTGCVASVPDQPGFTFNWTITGGTFSQGGTTAAGTSVTFTAGTGSSLTLTCTAGKDGVNSLQASKGVTVTPAPPAKPVITAPAAVSPGQSGVMASVSTQAGCTFAWIITGGTFSTGGTTASGQSVTFTAGTGSSLTLQCTAKNTANVSTASDIVTVRITKAPATPNILAPSSVAINSANNNASVPKQVGCTFNWTISGGKFADNSLATTGQSVTYTAGKDANLTLTCKAVNAAGVSSSPASLTIPVMNTTSPYIWVEPSAVTLTPGAKQRFNWGIANVNSASSSWSFTGGKLEFEGVIARYTAPDSAGTYKITVSGTGDAASCTPVVININVVAGVSVALLPLSVALPLNGPQSFTATVKGSTNAAVNWSVQEGTAGGTILQGNYTAPAKAGLYHVIATSVSDENKFDIARVEASNGVEVVLDPPEIVLETGTSRKINIYILGTTNKLFDQNNIIQGWGSLIYTYNNNADNNMIYTAGYQGQNAPSGRYSVTIRSLADTGKSAVAPIRVVQPPHAEIVEAPAVVTYGSGYAWTARVADQSIDDVTYLWQIEGGEIIGDNNKCAVSFRALAGGPALKITCTVRSLVDRVDTKSVMPRTVPPPIIQSFTGKSIITRGESTQLTPVFFDGTGSIDQTIGDVTSNVPVTVTPDQDTTYTLTVVNEARTSVQSSISVTLVDPPVAGISAASPVMTGQTHLKARVAIQANCTYKWRISGATIPGASIIGPDDQPEVTYSAGEPGNITLYCKVTNLAGTWLEGSKAVVVGQKLPAISGVYMDGFGRKVLLVSAGPSVKGFWMSTWNGKNTLEGTLEGYQLTGQYQTSLTDKRSFAFSFSPDGKSFSGAMEGGSTDSWTGRVIDGETGLFILPAFPEPLRITAAQKFTAYVAGSANTAVQWSRVDANNDGTLDDNGNYKAPNQPGAYEIQAVSVADPSKTDKVSLQVNQPVVVSPAQARVNINSLQTFYASLTGFANSAVEWSVVTPSGGTFADKTKGEYKAPGEPGIYKITATSVAEPTLFGEAMVTVLQPITISPASANLTLNGQQAFSVTYNGIPEGVNFTLLDPIGELNGSTYKAPPALSQNQSVRVQAESTVDVKWKSIATLNISSISIVPKNITLDAGSNASFYATFASGKSIRWECSGGGKIVDGWYTAPPKVGTYTVTAYDADNALLFATATVVVKLALKAEPPAVHLAVGGQPYPFTATVVGDPNTAVEWKMLDGPGTLSADGKYTPPPSISAQGTVAHIQAKSLADPGKTAICVIYIDYPVHVMPQLAQVAPGKTYQFNAVVTGQSTDAVKWSCLENPALINPDTGLFRAPMEGGPFTVRATLNNGSGKSGDAKAEIALIVRISPRDSAVYGSKPVQFQAAVFGNTNQEVEWSASSGTFKGSIYTPPPSPGIYTIKAVSKANNRYSDTTNITVAKAVEVLPDYIELRPGGKKAFSARVSGAEDPSVTWSATLGDIDTSGCYTAPPTEGRYKVTAKSVKTAAEGSATVLVSNKAPITVTISPAEVDMDKGGSQPFTATVIGPANRAVRWEPTTSFNGNVYTAPAKYGTYTIKAISLEDGKTYGMATVTVSNKTVTEKRFTYDDNGNMLSDGDRTFEWDDENRLLAVNVTSTGHRSEFGYDGLGRRAVIREFYKDISGELQKSSEKNYLFDGVSIAVERDVTVSANVTEKQFYSQGFVENDGTKLYYTRDHLGSIRELTDANQAVVARYDYDPYGRMTKTQGDKDSPFTYTGHFWHAPSGLNLAMYRAYDPNLGRWISRDAAEEGGGINLYQYVLNNPIYLIDPTGLGPWKPVPGTGGWDVRHDPSAGGGDPAHDHYRDPRGREYDRRVYPDGGQKKHGDDGIDKDVPQDVIDKNPRNKKKPKDCPTDSPKERTLPDWKRGWPFLDPDWDFHRTPLGIGLDAITPVPPPYVDPYKPVCPICGRQH